MTTSEANRELLVRPPADPLSREFQAYLMQSAGPRSTSDKWTFFDMNEMPWRAVGLEEGLDPDATHTCIKALVNHTDGEGFSMQAVKYLPGAEVARHRHDVAQIVFVVEGSASLGNKFIGPGEGYYTPAFAPYKVKAGPEGVVMLEFRHSPLNFSTEWVDGGPGEQAG
jgi:mannose-6-phosphate isomerase-like protein (cupin superfamily)